jgi:hypothetical protein
MSVSSNYSNQMQSIELTRADLADLLNGDRLSRTKHNLSAGAPSYPPAARKVWACWGQEREEPYALPALIIVADEELVDFLTWGIPFLRSLAPITSFCRVLPWRLFSEIRDNLPLLPLQRHNVFVGAILGEMLSVATGRGYLQLLPLVAFESTYSYALSRAIVCGYHPRHIDMISDGWKEARKIAGYEPRVEHEALEGVWAVILELQGMQSFRATRRDTSTLTAIAHACRVLEARGELSFEDLDRLTNGKVPPSIQLQSRAVSRERRVESFEDVVSTLTRYDPNSLGTDFLVGYYASLIGDGSLEHAHLVFPLLQRLPTAMLWYGICASLSPHTRVIADYAHLGLKLSRMLETRDHLLSYPAADIAILELQLSLRAGGIEQSALRRAHASFLRIELFPLVSTVVRWGRADAEFSTRQLSFSDSDTQEKQAAIKRVIDSLRRSLEIVEGLAADSGTNPPPASSKFRARRPR